MKLGINLPQLGPAASGENMVAVAQKAEEVGFGSVWVTERLLFPTNPRTPYMVTPDGSLPDVYRIVYEPLEALAWVAAHTKTIRLGTSVLDIPFYNPVMFARRVSSIDQLSGGRLTLGLGLGWSEDEMEASGADMKVRGQRADEFLEVLHAIWKDDPAEYSGKHFKLASSTILPKPVQKPHPPIYLAAYAPAAMSRVARLADGWIPAGVPVEGMSQMFSGIQNMAKEAGRDPSELKMIVRANLEVRSEPRGDQGFVFSGTRDEIKADIAAVRELGVEELHFDPSFDAPGGSLQGFLDPIELVRALAS